MDHRKVGFTIGKHPAFRLARAMFEKLVREFYVGVATDEVLLPMYPEQPALEGAIQRMTGFL